MDNNNQCQNCQFDNEIMIITGNDTCVDCGRKITRVTTTEIVKPPRDKMIRKTKTKKMR